MNFAENASRFFNRGYSCSQSVLSAYAPGYGLDERSAFKLASAFGGGMAHLDGACGAVTGALMVIGLAKFRDDITVSAAKHEVYTATEDFVEEFRRRNGHINCTQLLGYNLSKPEELKQAADERIFNEVCPQYLQDAVDILKKLLS